MADESVFIVVNFNDARFMIEVDSNSTIKELRSEIENVGAKEYPQLRGKEAAVIQNCLGADLHNHHNVKKVLQGNYEVFVYSPDDLASSSRVSYGDKKPNKFKNPEILKKKSSRWKLKRYVYAQPTDKLKKKEQGSAEEALRQTLKGKQNDTENNELDKSSTCSPIFKRVTGCKEKKTKAEINREMTVNQINILHESSGDTLGSFNTKKGRRISRGLVWADSLPTPPISPALAMQAGTSADKYKELTKKVKPGNRKQERAIKRSVRKVTSWLANHEKHLSTESKDEDEICADTTDGDDSGVGEPLIGTESPKSKQNHHSDQEEEDDDSSKDLSHLQTILFPVLEVIGNKVIYYDERMVKESDGWGMVQETKLKFPQIVLPKLDVPSLKSEDRECSFISLTRNELPERDKESPPVLKHKDDVTSDMIENKNENDGIAHEHVKEHVTQVPTRKTRKSLMSVVDKLRTEMELAYEKKNKDGLCIETPPETATEDGLGLNEKEAEIGLDTETGEKEREAYDDINTGDLGRSKSDSVEDNIEKENKQKDETGYEGVDGGEDEKQRKGKNNRVDIERSNLIPEQGSELKQHSTLKNGTSNQLQTVSSFLDDCANGTRTTSEELTTEEEIQQIIKRKRTESSEREKPMSLRNEDEEQEERVVESQECTELVSGDLSLKTDVANEKDIAFAAEKKVKTSSGKKRKRNKMKKISTAKLREDVSDKIEGSEQGIVTEDNRFAEWKHFDNSERSKSSSKTNGNQNSKLETSENSFQEAQQSAELEKREKSERVKNLKRKLRRIFKPKKKKKTFDSGEARTLENVEDRTELVANEVPNTSNEREKKENIKQERRNHKKKNKRNLIESSPLAEFQTELNRQDESTEMHSIQEAQDESNKMYNLSAVKDKKQKKKKEDKECEETLLRVDGERVKEMSEKQESLNDSKDMTTFITNKKHKKKQGKERKDIKVINTPSNKVERDTYAKEVERGDSCELDIRKETRSGKETTILGESTEISNNSFDRKSCKKAKKCKRKEKQNEVPMKMEVKMVTNTICENVSAPETIEKKVKDNKNVRKRSCSFSTDDDFEIKKKCVIQKDCIKKNLLNDFHGFNIKNVHQDTKKSNQSKDAEEKKKKGEDDLKLNPKKSVEVMFTSAEEDSHDGKIINKVVKETIKACSAKKSGSKAKSRNSFMDLVEDDLTNRSFERRKESSSTSRLLTSTPKYIRPFNSPPKGFTDDLTFIKKKKKKSQLTFNPLQITRRTIPNVFHQQRELTPIEKELFDRGRQDISSLLNNDSIWE